MGAALRRAPVEAELERGPSWDDPNGRDLLRADALRVSRELDLTRHFRAGLSIAAPSGLWLGCQIMSFLYTGTFVRPTSNADRSVRATQFEIATFVQRRLRARVK